MLEIEIKGETAYDQQWIAQNGGLFAPLAREGFETLHRGAIVANVGALVLRKFGAEGHPFNYRAASDWDWQDTEEIRELSLRVSLHDLLRVYNPAEEFIAVLVKDFRADVYRVPLPAPEDLDPEIRGAYVEAEAEERRARLSCTDKSGLDFRLAGRYEKLWAEN